MKFMSRIGLGLLLIVSISEIGCKKDEAFEFGEIRPVEGDYYVSADGNDDNPGTDSLPWRTIQKAVNAISPGNILVVRAGNYNEYVTIDKNGESDDLRLTLFSETLHGAKCLGFKVKGNYVTIDGFNIEADAKKSWTGIIVAGYSGVNILNNYIHECPTTGIKMNMGSTFGKITNNKIEHNGQAGISIIGSDILVQGNIVSRSVQYHPKGDEPGFVGNDADGLRIFGQNHIIKGNSIIDIGDPDDGGNVNPHVDCIQTWDGSSNGAPVMTNTIIEGNYFRVKHNTGKGILLETNAGNPCHDLIIRNNIFEFRDIAVAAFSGEFSDIFICNNVFKSSLTGSSWGTSVALTNVTNYSFLNNITVDCDNEHRKIIGGTGIVRYNLAWNSDGSNISMVPELQENELIGIDPKFIKYTGNHGENNYHLQVGSPAINKGTTLDEVTNDYDGTLRPQGSIYDIGAFEFIESK